ncbi:alpha/beta hydrolase family protein [Bifidobacterium aquikefiri]|uniref:alpha/beta hydrolase family protein n=1 Tax=Bifidobacterium aquikefiri TaxID=1653207 RepID=UPI0023F406BE|nr:alpha/beta hydrolase [Bifidobacterium aquikefiri]
MSCVSNQDQSAESSKVWSWSKRLTLSLPIFIIFIALLTSVSNATAVPWNNNPIDQSMETVDSDTSVNFANPQQLSLAQRGSYNVVERRATIDVKQSATGAKQHIHILIREPQGIRGKLPGIVFMHGAGYGTAEDSFGDVASDLSSAGFVSAVIDKPVWNTSDANRDYPASAKAYDKVIDYLRQLSNVDASNVGIYATSESTWISSYLLQSDHAVAFQILLSPMVHSPRHSLGFLAAQDFAMVGANPGYQSIVRRLFSADLDLFGLHNMDINTLKPAAYAIPTFVAYGAKDVMTAQVDGAQTIMKLAHEANNWNVTIRNYPLANHVLRLGDEAQTNTPLVDSYENDMVDWAVGVTHGLKQTSQLVTGATITQSIAVPFDLKSRPTLTVYMLVIHGAALIFILTTIIMWIVALIRKFRSLLRRDSRHILGFTHGFGGILILITGTTLATLVLFFSGLAQVVYAVVKLVWGGAPETAGMIYWSWPVIQIVSTLVVWAWSRVFARLIEVASIRGLLKIPTLATIRDFLLKRHRDNRHDQIKDQTLPVISYTRFGKALFVNTTIAMFCVLLLFAFWGLFIY